MAKLFFPVDGIKQITIVVRDGVPRVTATVHMDGCMPEHIDCGSVGGPLFTQLLAASEAVYDAALAGAKAGRIAGWREPTAEDLAERVRK